MERWRASREEGPRYVLQQVGLKMADVLEAWREVEHRSC